MGLGTVISKLKMSGLEVIHHAPNAASFSAQVWPGPRKFPTCIMSCATAAETEETEGFARLRVGGPNEGEGIGYRVRVAPPGTTNIQAPPQR